MATLTKKNILILWAFIILFTLSLGACGPSQEELDATATQVAANIFATQTASVPTATNTPREVKSMPNLKHLLDDLDEMGVEPEKVRIPGQLYDNLVADAEESGEDEE